MSETSEISRDSLTEAQHAAIRARAHDLLDWTAVAKKAGVDARTIYEWRKLPAFAAALEAEIAQLDADSRERRKFAERIAWGALIDVAGDAAQRGGDRVKAADSILDRIGQVRGGKLTVEVSAVSPEEREARRAEYVAELARRRLGGGEE